MSFLRFRDELWRDGLALASLRPLKPAFLLSLITSGILIASCSDDDAVPTAADGYGYDSPASGSTSGAGIAASGGFSSVSPPPQEIEREESFLAPVVQGDYLWSANPDSNKVARIHASTLAIQVLEGGHAPTYLAALPKGETEGGALVINARSHDASIFLEDSDGSILVEHRVKVQEGASAWAVGAQGSFAVAWSQASESLLDSLDGYQDLTILSIGEKEVKTTSLSVGFRPSRVFINDDESRAYVVSEPGISIIVLDDTIKIERELFLPEELPGQARDVVFTQDGSLALVRVSLSADILAIDTKTGEQKVISLPGPATDLDISEDGTIAVAVSRAEQEPDSGIGGQGGQGGALQIPIAAKSSIALLPTATIFGDPTNFEVISTEEIVGSAVVSADASRILLFTNATPSSRLSILATKSADLRVVDLKAPLQAAFIGENAEHAVTLMSPAAGSQKAGAFALVPLKDELAPRIEGTNTVPLFVNISSDPERALVTTQSTASEAGTLYFGRLPELTLDKIALPSAPLSAGLVPEAAQAFVSQSHPEGRVTFIDLDSGSEKTVTGFELSSKVVE